MYCNKVASNLLTYKHEYVQNYLKFCNVQLSSVYESYKLMLVRFMLMKCPRNRAGQLSPHQSVLPPNFWDNKTSALFLW